MAARMRGYVPQRQMLPLMAASICASVGLGVVFSSDAACIICPGWQYPHWGTLCSRQATWIGCDPSLESPSMVVMLAPTAAETLVWQDRTALPFRCTVQQPHSP